MTRSHYETLGVRPGAEAAAIRRAYHDLARQLHPDRLIDASPAERERAAARMREVNEAWRVLGDRARRRAYDLGRRPAAAGPTREPTDWDDGDDLDGVDLSAHLIRGLPWIAILAVLLLIFLVTAFAGGGTTEASECVLVLQGPSTTAVPCDEPEVRRVVAHVPPGSPAP